MRLIECRCSQRMMDIVAKPIPLFGDPEEIAVEFSVAVLVMHYSHSIGALGDMAKNIRDAFAMDTKMDALEAFGNVWESTLVLEKPDHDLTLGRLDTRNTHMDRATLYQSYTHD